ncbi:T9SS outer membrane translocon Sov/SprA [Psychroflexus planctonicus]|uniref:Cell surface protein SprA n=1 Tax=Psychroflexus planctonicus TaxID=1526575 RepID=A0ABQ1SDB4_9FLAO|nr:cell surface protein SprA [Psychroflexus planctonicus]GGE24293.1 cell surface protein SprA [Psychroflexus planctonicus]
MSNKRNFLRQHKKFIFLAVILFITAFTFAQEEETEQDSIQEGYTFGKVKIKDPESIQNLYTYDPIIDRYIFSQKIGDVNISYPMVLTPEEYQDLVLREQMKEYFKQKSDAAKDPENEESKNLIPAFYVNNSFFESIFGGSKIEVIPQGQVSMDLGVLYSKQDNPSLSPRNQSNTTLDFDQRINLSLEGTVGTRVNIAAQYNTQSTFDFQNQIKIDYTPEEDDIVQKIEVGNVNMPLNSSLIQGAESLFGVKAQLKFGKTTITGVFSEMNSERQSVNVEGGGTVDEFDKFGLEYDENKHFFLSQAFRDEYDTALLNYPFINSKFQITRVQIWVTNRNNNPQSLQNARNIVAIQDLGESDPDKVGLFLDNNGNPIAPPIPNFINQLNALPDNRNNDFNPLGINGGGSSILTPAIRDISTVAQGFGPASQFVTEGRDYGVLENARQLSPNEYTLHPQLGYVSLNQRISNDEILAIAYEYTSNGRVYKVGEFANDGVDSSQPSQNQNPEPGQENQPVTINQNLVVKMLKSPITNVNEPIWDLMMKNIYSIGGYDIEQEGFRFNILYTDPQPVNFLQQAPGSNTALPEDVADQNLLQLLNFDRLNSNGDLPGSDGFFDFVPGITIDRQNGFIKFTKVEPFGEFLFEELNNTPGATYQDQSTWNENQLQYVFQALYETTKTQAMQQEAERNKFQLRGQYRASGQEGIPIGAFNVPRGSVEVTAGGRTLQEGVDYVVNYELGLVQILDEALKASDTPIQVSTENNAVFGRQTKRFTGIDVQHEFSENFILGGTFLNMNERPLTQKSNYGSEPISNTMYGINFNYNTTVPFFTRIVNKLPNINTEVESNFSIRGEFAYIQPGTPDADNFGGRDASYIDDFEASQTSISLLNPQPWSLSSVPVGYRGPNDAGGNFNANDDISINHYRAKLNWYTIDPIFYSTQRPANMTDDDLSFWYSRRILINEIFPNRDIVPGQFQTIPTFDLVFKPTERGMYNFNPAAASNGNLPNPDQNFGGIMRGLETTDFERSNVEFVEFWVMDPFIYPENAGNDGGKLVLNFGSVSEDVLKDGRKQYENGLPEDGGTQNTLQTTFAKVPANQSLVYAFDTEGAQRANQDVGFDGYDNEAEAANFPDFANFEDPAGDDYDFYLQRDGGILNRYEKYNGSEGNNPVEVTQNFRGNSPLPDVEDVNRDNTMNTIDSYFEYEVPMYPNMSVDNNTSAIAGVSEDYITDVKELTTTAPNGEEVPVRWVQFRVPLRTSSEYSVGGISDLRAVRFMRMFMTDFSQETILRMGSLDLVRGDYLTYDQPVLPDGTDPTTTSSTSFSITPVSEEITSRYVTPPGVIREQIVNNNVVIREDEQSLALSVKNLQPEDSRAVFKNFQVDMRQYRFLEMFLHAEALPPPETQLQDGQMVAYIRMGVDFTNNFYEIEVPLKVSDISDTSPRGVWPLENDLELDLELLQQIKATVIGSENFSSLDLNFFDENLNPSPDFQTEGLRLGIKGNPSFGNIRVLMIGLRNASDQNISGQVWFNELRVSELKSQGGWAAVLDLDTNIADFATFSGSASRTTIGFGSIDQGPNQRSIEDTQQYDFVTGLNVGQLLPEDWGIKIPFNYGRGEELVTPRFDPVLLDIELDNLLDNTEDPQLRDEFSERAEAYTKRQSISIIGLRKDRTNQDRIPKPWDIENFTLSGTYNQVEHRDFEIQQSVDQNLDFNANYAYNFAEVEIEPLKNIEFLNKSKYFDLLKDFNLNLLPTSLTASSSVIRQYSEVRFRELNLPPGSIGLPKLYQRNYFYNWQYALDWDLTKNLNINFNASQNRIVRNFLDEDLNQDDSVGVWDGFFDVGVPNTHMQTLQLNYSLPFDKIPALKFIQSNYSFTGDFQWQKGSEILRNLEGIPNIGNTVQNSSAHQINNTLNMSRLYNYLNLKKRKAKGDAAGQQLQRGADRRNPRAGAKGSFTKSNDQKQDDEDAKDKLSFGDHFYNLGVSLLTMVDRVQLNYTENRGTFIPGFTHDIGFTGTLTPSPLFTFGGQRDVRQRAAMNRWLTEYQEFNEQYMATNTEQLDFNASVKLIPGMTLDIIANRQYAETYTENFRVDRESLQYQSLTPNTFGNFSISTMMIGTAFSESTRENSPVFEQFRENRLAIARRLAIQAGINPDDPENVDDNGYPSGFGRTNQAVLIPAFLSAYTDQNPESVSLSPFRDTPLPNWNFKYTGLMKLKWFKDNFNRFSIQHGYQSSYTMNAFQSNLDFDRRDPYGEFNRDQNGNFKNELYIANMNLMEVFSPLVQVDFEMKNSVSILTEIKKDRTLSLSFDNNLLTEMIGQEYIAGLGYRIKDLRIVTQFEGNRRVISSDLNLKLDVAYRRNETIIRGLDVINNRTTAGQDIWSINFLADYMITKQLTVIFFYDHIFTENAISTIFPQTTIRTGLTLTYNFGN